MIFKNNIKKIIFFIIIAFSLYFSSTCYSKKITGKLIIHENGSPIPDNSIVYINNSPEFPDLAAALPVNSKEPVKWQFKAVFNRPNRDKEQPFIVNHTGNSTWDFSKEMENMFIGGTIIITANTSNSFFYSTFQIRACNPSEAEVREYIGNEPKFALAIAIHESGIQNGRSLCQFNEIGELGENYLVHIKHTPNRGDDTLGWGIFQITEPNPSKDELWNWKKNIDTGKKIIINKKHDALEYFEAVKRTYPNEYESPPEQFTLSGTKTKLTAVEATTIQLYNGGSVVKRLLDCDGRYSPFASCWEFVKSNPSGKKWKFVPNKNNYVRSIITIYENL